MLHLRCFAVLGFVLGLASAQTVPSSRKLLQEPLAAKDGWYFLHPHNAAPTGVQLRAGWCLDIAFNSRLDNENLVMYICKPTGFEDELWRPQLTAAGKVTFRSQHSNKCVQMGAAGANVVQFTCNRGASQSFDLVSVGGSQTTWQLRSALNPELCLAIVGNSMAEWALLTAATCNPAVGGQVWTMTLQQEIGNAIVNLPVWPPKDAIAAPVAKEAIPEPAPTPVVIPPAPAPVVTPPVAGSPRPATPLLGKLANAYFSLHPYNGGAGGANAPRLDWCASVAYYSFAVGEALTMTACKAKTMNLEVGTDAWVAETSDQQFRLAPAAKAGLVVLSARHSLLCLAASAATGKVTQETCIEGEAQTWALEAAGNGLPTGWWSIKNVASGQCLGLPSAAEWVAPGLVACDPKQGRQVWALSQQQLITGAGQVNIIPPPENKVVVNPTPDVEVAEGKLRRGWYTFSPNNGGANGAVGARPKDCMDVAGYTVEDNAWMHIYGCKLTEVTNQYFMPTTLPKGNLQFTVQMSNKCLQPGGTTGVDVVQLPCSGAASQQWQLVQIPGVQGQTYQVRHVGSNLCMSLLGNSIAEFTKVTMEPCNQALGQQRWTLELKEPVGNLLVDTTPFTAPAPVPEAPKENIAVISGKIQRGFYTLSPNNAAGKVGPRLDVCMDVAGYTVADNAFMHIYDCKLTEVTNQYFLPTALPGGNIQLSVQMSEKCLEPKGAEVVQLPCLGASTQQWQLVEVAEAKNVFQVRHVDSNTCMSLENNGLELFTKVALEACDAKLGQQQWSFVLKEPSADQGTVSYVASGTGANNANTPAAGTPAAGAPAAGTPATGTPAAAAAKPALIEGAPINIPRAFYTLQPITGTCIQVPGLQALAQVQPAVCQDADNQQFLTSVLPGGGVQLSIKTNGMCLQVFGTTVVQATCTGLAVQQWQILQLPNGARHLQSLSSHLCLGLAPGGAAIETQTCTLGAAGQAWNWVLTEAVGEYEVVAAINTQQLFQQGFIPPPGFYTLSPNNGGPAGSVGPRLATCMDVAGYTVADDAWMHTYPCKDTEFTNQYFRPLALANNYLQFSVLMSGKCLQPGGVTTFDVVQLPCTGAAAQQWQMLPVLGAPNTYNVRHPTRNLCMSLAGNSLALYTKVVLEACNPALGQQQWTFVFKQPVAGAA